MSAMFTLEGKVAVVTGSASGIGRATALRFARAGASVVCADLKDASEVADEAGGIFIRTDVSKEEQVKALMEGAASRYGKVTTVVNNAGIDQAEACFIEATREEDMDLVLGVNFKGVFLGIKHAVPHMTGGGSIMNTSSYAGMFGAPTYGSYVAAKAAVIGITKTAALELGNRNIRVNCICPTTVDTPMAYVEGAEIELAVSAKLQSVERMASPEEAAALFHYLASDESAFITGQAIGFDGGMSAGPSLGAVGILYEKLAGQEINISNFTCG